MVPNVHSVYRQNSVERTFVLKPTRVLAGIFQVVAKRDLKLARQTPERILSRLSSSVPELGRRNRPDGGQTFLN